jgi:S1-C subfamily serine protease
LARAFARRALAAKLLLAGALLALPLLGGAGSAAGDIYQYRDQKGNWVITDSPPGDARVVQTIRDPGGRSPGAGGFRDIDGELKAKYRPQGDVEAASLSTVTLRTAIGVGSGFFISGSCHILTNRHVLQGDETQQKETERAIAQLDDRIESEEKAIAHAEQQLGRIRGDLEAYRASIEGMASPDARSAALQRYQSQAEQYDFHEAQLRKRKGEFEEYRAKFRQQKGAFAQKTRMARYDRTFGVILKDGTELEAALAAVSPDLDLALLRIEGCRSPFLTPGAPVAQGMKVYAIGSPLGLGDSVSSGVVSGYDQEYIRTDARIYPGNSGGPLITADGKVIGINTLKLITRKFEGLGFAIPIGRALQEFGAQLGPRP